MHNKNLEMFLTNISKEGKIIKQEEIVNSFHIWITTFVMIVIIITGLVANSMLIIAVCTISKLQNVTNTFIVNLSICDLMFVVIILPVNIYTYTQQGWFFHEGICQTIGFLGYTFTGTTLMTISIIAWVRYQLVTNCSEFKVRFCKRNVCILLGASWIMPALCQIPAVTGLWGKFGYVPIMVSCNLLLDHSTQSFKIFLLVVRAIIPSVLIIYCYAIINYTTRKSHKKLKSLKGKRITRSDFTSKISKKEMRLTKITSILFIVFALSYFPCAISGIVDWNRMLSKTFHLYCQLSLYIGSFCNPLVYGLMNKQFRVAYIKMLRYSVVTTSDEAATKQIKEQC